MKGKDLPYGPVLVTDGEYAGRIGCYDDRHPVFDDDEPELAEHFADAPGWRSADFDEQELKDLELDVAPQVLDVAIVYFGDFLLADSYVYIPFAHLRPVTTDDLMARRDELGRSLGVYAADEKRPSVSTKYEVMLELHYVESVLVSRMIEVRYKNNSRAARVFISHSSKDKQFARWLSTDLHAAGHTPWLDEWSIRVGESIPGKISEGLQRCDFVVVILSKNSVSSNWVEREWHARYWDEVERGEVVVLPVLLEDCEVPELLKTKRYANFQRNYNDGLEDLLQAIDTLGDGDA